MLVIGIDAGGSAVRGRSDAGFFCLEEPSNARTMGAELAAERILRVVNALAKGEAVDALYVGAAGAGDPAVAADLMAALARELGEQCVIGVGDDLHIALRAAIDEDGAALIAGTGSIAYAEVAGKRYRSGGYGPVLGDEGSGFAIGADALRLTLRVLDGRAPRNALTDEIVQRVSGDAYDFVALANDSGKIAAVAPTVIECASNGELEASAIVERAADALYVLAHNVAKKIAADRALGEHELPMALCGGLLLHQPFLSDLVKQHLQKLHEVRVVAGADPALGALKVAHASLTVRS
jgi:N-acetylglucosamine kinase-like BadF-type ATPase